MSNSDTQIINQQLTRYLARREHSRAELMQKLVAKGFEPDLCSQQIECFEQRGLQSDERFCESFIRNAYANGKGPRHIHASLSQHDIDGSTISANFEALELDWFALACAVREKKFGDATPSDFSARQKQMRFLQYRGFSQDQITHACGNH